LNIREETESVLDRLGVGRESRARTGLAVRSPINGEIIATVCQSSESDALQTIDTASSAFRRSRLVPAHAAANSFALAEELRREKTALGGLVTIEVGKTLGEGLGEVQEMIDICDFAIGLFAV
jgi:aldehyde dehydrogenase (NAD+)